MAVSHVAMQNLTYWHIYIILTAAANVGPATQLGHRCSLRWLKSEVNLLTLGPGALGITGSEPRNPVALAQAVELRAGSFAEW